MDDSVGPQTSARGLLQMGTSHCVFTQLALPRALLLYTIREDSTYSECGVVKSSLLERLNMKLDRKLETGWCRFTCSHGLPLPPLPIADLSRVPSRPFNGTSHYPFIRYASSRNKQCLLVQALKLETLRLRHSFKFQDTLLA